MAQISAKQLGEHYILWSEGCVRKILAAAAWFLGFGRVSQHDSLVSQIALVLGLAVSSPMED